MQAPRPNNSLWLALRNGQIGGLKFRRQHPIGPYVVDFCCQSAKLVVEVDGMSHADKAAQDAAKRNTSNRRACGSFASRTGT